MLSTPGSTELYLSDIHYPYHDPAGEQLTHEVIKTLQPHTLFLGGDVLDFYSVSSFSKDPARKLDLQTDLDFAHARLARYREEAPNTHILFQEGNHEFRLQRYLWSRAEELSGLRALTIPELLDFKGLEITWIPQGELFKIGDLHHIHGNEIGGGSVSPARNIFIKAPGNTIFGHYHVIQAHYHRTLEGKTYGTWANGCLCTLTPEYLLFPQWTQGFSLIEYARNGRFHVNQIPIFQDGNHMACVIAGQVLSVTRGRSRGQTR